MDSKSIYLVLLMALGGIIFLQISESVQSTDPGPEPYPVMPGTTNWLFCSPLLDKKSVTQAGWFILQSDEWSWIAGVGRPAENTTDSWVYQLSREYTRYGFFGSNFLEIRNVTKEDNGSIYRCRIVTWDGHPKSVHFKLQVLEPKQAPPSTTTPAPTTSASTTPTTTPRPPDHDRDVDMCCECTSWKIGVTSICLLLIVIAAVVIVWKIYRYCTADQAGRRVDGGPEVVNTANESHRYVVNYRNGIENGNERGSKATLDDDDDDGDVPMLKP